MREERGERERRGVSEIIEHVSFLILDTCIFDTRYILKYKYIGREQMREERGEKREASKRSVSIVE